MTPAVPFVVVIPARMSSTRLPGKPLADIGGKPMCVRVAERAKASGALVVYVATDDVGVIAACTKHGFAAVLTSPDHAQGTDRIAEVVTRLHFDDETIVVNVQGDEPLIAPELICEVAATLAGKRSASIATASHVISEAADFFNPNVVKVVTDREGYAQYFSRAPIPYARDAFSADRTVLPAAFIAQRHIGIYAYRAAFLKCYANLTPAPTEQWEALEQLRAMYHGYNIAVLEWQGEIAPGVDTPDDLARVQALFRQNENSNEASKTDASQK